MVEMVTMMMIIIISHPAGLSVSGTRVGKTWAGWEAGCNLILIALGRGLARLDDHHFKDQDEKFENRI